MWLSTEMLARWDLHATSSITCGGVRDGPRTGKDPADLDMGTVGVCAASK